MNTEARSLGAAEVTDPRGSIGEVFFAMLRLGFTSFGGPVAHLVYFRNELVLRRRRIDESGYGNLVALCQFLPGPASSQVGVSLRREPWPEINPEGRRSNVHTNSS